MARSLKITVTGIIVAACLMPAHAGQSFGGGGGGWGGSGQQGQGGSQSGTTSNRRFTLPFESLDHEMQGKNMMPTCEGGMTDNLATRAPATNTQGDDCARFENILNGGTNIPIMSTFKKPDSVAKDGSPLQIERLPAAGLDNWGKVYQKIMAGSSSINATRTENNRGRILATKVVAGDQEDDPNSRAPLTVDTSTGESIVSRSDTFRTEKEVAEAGACLMVEVKDSEDGDFWVSKLSTPEKVYASDGKTVRYLKRYQVHERGGSGNNVKRVALQRIEDFASPFSPRHGREWTEARSKWRIDGGKKFTEVCGNDQKDKLPNQPYAWTNMHRNGSPQYDKNNYDEDSDKYKNNKSYYKKQEDDDGNLKKDNRSVMGDMQGEKNNVGDNGSNYSVTEFGTDAFQANYEYYGQYFGDNARLTSITIGNKTVKPKILTTPQRHVLYVITAEIIYDVCNYTTYNMVEDMCEDLAQYTSCRMHILPPVRMTNPLQTAYVNNDALEPIKPDLPNFTTIFQRSWSASDEGLSAYAGGSGVGGGGGLGGQASGIATDSINAGAGAAGIDTGAISQATGSANQDTVGSNGMTWIDSVPMESNFGLSAPWMKDLTTGTVASKAVTANHQPKDFEPHRTAIIGVHMGDMALDASNQMEEGVHGETHVSGVWNELIDYQNMCDKLLQVKCLCDYENYASTFTAANRAMQMKGAYIPVQNKVDSKVREVNLQGQYSDYLQTDYNKGKMPTKFYQGVDTSGVRYWPRNFPAVLGGKYVKKGAPGLPMHDGSMWPGAEGTTNSKGKKVIFKGLGSNPGAEGDNVKSGHLIVWDGTEQTSSFRSEKGEAYRAPFVAVVDKTVGNCVDVIGFDNGQVRNIANISERAGAASRTRICNPSIAGTAKPVFYEQGGQQKMPGCHVGYVAECIEYDWSKIKVWDIDNDDRHFGPDGKPI